MLFTDGSPRMLETQLETVSVNRYCCRDDFVKNVTGIGIHQAYDLVVKCDLMESVVERGAFQEYKNISA